MKMNEMQMTIEELRTAAAAVVEAADWLASQFSGDATAVEAEKTPPVAKPSITLEDVRAVLADISRSGLTAQVRELLQKHGGNKLSEIAPERYAALLRDAEELKNES